MYIDEMAILIGMQGKRVVVTGCYKQSDEVRLNMRFDQIWPLEITKGTMEVCLFLQT